MKKIILLLAVLGTQLFSGCREHAEPVVVVDFWALGREGEVVRQLVPEFERTHPGIKVKVQQIPWSAAHEKLLTAFAGRVMPDVFQLGNTWLPEFVALKAIHPLGEQVSRSNDLPLDDFFSGIVDSNRVETRLYGIPWYVDTRVLFYRKDLLTQAGFDRPPATWEEWMDMMEHVKRLDSARYALLIPMNEWQLPVILGLQLGAHLLKDNNCRGDFESPEFRQAFRFYREIYRRELAPALAESQIANLYQEFANSYFSMFITGPWNIGEFRHRLPAELQEQWATAPMPAPMAGTAGLSLAGGASLALSAASAKKAEAWQWIEFLSRSEQQAAFYRLSGDLPVRRSAWQDEILAADDKAAAFRQQLEAVVSLPRIPEWERIASRLAIALERAIRDGASDDEVLSELDRDVDRILEKRRWLLEHRS
ncbi:sugar ABC transporter substrate-binding protein [Candidatus Methylospira mobilis]|uniref:Sugar ABC transporter substrate-binding protein n=1 Tax=Candidatus Methylospira mobilis TaxID=1808979 RepID=A0A5Q0BIY9_9GAMM|nr:sugar ABC transporter substrate-binding protein [Candidatus Methylospira mobilis]QFY42108.1 sugar ABC transporter substrate-binding protein [Candidatus Methylospira mobilis]WNV03118.1 sugar ABC transporter substrate-binding protein [Candidatus Methylospira mobilis]